MIRLATIGSGGIVDKFLEGLQRVPELVHTAVYSRSEETGHAFAQKHGITAVWTDLIAMADSGEIDAVYLATPNRFHAAQAEIFLSRGIHVLCEKPAAVTPEELKALHQSAEAHQAIFVEAVMAPHLPRFALLKKAIGEIGKVTAAELNFSQLSSKYLAFCRGENPNIFNPAMCTGALMDIGVYDVCLAAALFGKPDKLTATATFLPGGCDGNGYALLQYSWGICSLNWSKVAQSRVNSEILGDRGTITFAPVSRLLDLTLWQPDGSNTLLFGRESHGISMSYEAADFVRYILHPEDSEYEEMKALSILTAELMADIRQQCGITYPSI